MIREITEDNVSDLTQYLGEDVAENIGREYFYGLGLFDALEEPAAALVWCIKNTDCFDDAQAELCFFSYENEEDGRELLQEYSERVLDENVIRSFFEFEGLGKDNEQMLKHEGFKVKKTEGKNLFVKLEELSEMRFAAKKSTPSYIVSLDRVTQAQFKQGVTNCMFAGRAGVNEDLAMLPMEWYEKEISACVITDGKAKGFLLIHRRPSGILMPVLLYASGVDARKEMLNMMRFCINAAVKKYPGDTKVLIYRYDDNTRSLSSYLFPGKKGDKVTVGERAESE